MLIGIVGKPSVGKSTFFKAATLAEVEISSRPFTTINPNEGIGFIRVPCPETLFKVKCNPNKGFCIDGQRFVPVKLLDVAGLVPGAHLGKGLGNKFLADLIQADVLIHVIDASGSTNETGEKVEAGSYDSVQDVEFLEKELDYWFTGLLKDNWSKFVRQSLQKPADKALAEQFYGFKITLQQITEAMKKAQLKEKKLSDWSDDDILKFAGILRHLSKPTIIAANKIDLPTSKKNLDILMHRFPNHLIVPCSAESELALREAAKLELIKYIPGDNKFDISYASKLSDRQHEALKFIDQKILKTWGDTGVQKCLNAAVLDFLKEVVIFPGGLKKLGDSKGNILPDAFILPQHSTALDFARKIHTDLADNFVAAIDVKTRQKISREKELKHLDIIEIMTSK